MLIHVHNEIDEPDSETPSQDPELWTPPKGAYDHYLEVDGDDLLVVDSDSPRTEGASLFPSTGYLAKRSDFGLLESFDEVLDHLLENNPWVTSRHAEIEANSPAIDGHWVVRDEYFKQHSTDHLLAIPSWSRATSVATIGDVDLVVPVDLTVAVGTVDGWWVLMGIGTGFQTAITHSVQIVRADLGDVSSTPRFPLHRWMLEALRKANEQLLAGATAPDFRHKSQTRQRSDSPTSEELAHVVMLREEQHMSFALIGEAIGMSKSAARSRYYKGKGQGL